MKVYLCIQAIAWGSQIEGVFLHEKDAQDMANECNKKANPNFLTRVYAHEVIE